MSRITHGAVLALALAACGCAEEAPKPGVHAGPHFAGGGAKSEQLAGMVPEFVTFSPTSQDVNQVAPAKHIDDDSAAAAAPAAATAAAAAPPAPPAPPAQFGDNTRWTQAAVPLRHRPQQGDAVFAQLTPGAQVEYVSAMTNEAGAWNFVRTPSGPAWVPAKLLKPAP